MEYLIAMLLISFMVFRMTDVGILNVLCRFDIVCVWLVPLAPGVRIIIGSICQPCSVIFDCMGLYLFSFWEIESGENLSLQDVNSMCCILYLVFGVMGVVP